MFQLQFFSENSSLLGNIYIGKVKHVLKNIDAAFVEIAGGQTGFLPLSEAASPVLTNRVYTGQLVNGDELLVQVKKDAVKTKDPVLTAQLSFPGRFAAVNMDGSKKVHYSHKLDQETRKRIAHAITDISLPRQAGLVIRSEAGALDDPEPLVEEIKSLLAQAEHILKTGSMRTVYSRLNDTQPSYIRMLDELYSGIPDKIITDIPEVHTRLKLYLQQNRPELLDRLTLYNDSSLNLHKLYGLQAKTEEALNRNIWLKSGGYLVIEPTEALVVIDVNSGKYAGKKATSDTFFLINREAAEEVARQLSLRNLSGIILVDFINMDSKAHQGELLTYLDSLLRQDPVTTRLIDMTPLGLVEITRKKVHRNLKEQLSSN